LTQADRNGSAYAKEVLPMTEHVDVLVVGAGLSGIGAGYHLQANCPGRTYAIFEGRADLGGTWDLFRYPGIRSDSDMYTLGYSFKPWTEAKAIADGPSIMKYLRETVRDYGIDKHIRFGLHVKRAHWSTDEARWTVEAERVGTGEVVRITCNFVFMCSGYYNYESGYTPDFAGMDSFAGRIVHPQKWTPDIDYAGKRVVVIGSGATAVTLVPELAKQAAHVTMLQRSPTYVISRPAEDRIANGLRRILPSKIAYSVTRWKNVLMGMYFFGLCRRKPDVAKKGILDMVRTELGPDYDVQKHFTPSYNPWEQRLCLVPDSDLFQSLKSGRASVVTDHIEAFTATGLKLKSGTELPADLVVTATGLRMQVLSDLLIDVDGVPIQQADKMIYKGMMYSDVPNMAFAFGYTNASWTLKADLTSEFVCRLLNHMKKTGIQQCTPRLTDTTVTSEPFVDFSSGYFQRAQDLLPKQGSKKPWKLNQNYALDIMTLKYGKLDDGTMAFTSPPLANVAA
jgi:monooxygenase